MCGISGIINADRSNVKKNEIEDINNLIAHRGPDDDGFYYGKNFAFGHRRLSIIDLSELGHQPMEYQEKYVITFNGEIYNYLEIRTELLELGYKFKSQTDTEVILAAYDAWGNDCVKKFNGMWAFSIFNKAKNLLFCSRDRFGIKPFYYTKIKNKFIFGSEIKQLLYFHDNNIANTRILLDFIITGLEEHTEETFYKDVFKLKQSHNLIYNLNTNEYKIEQYFDLQKDNEVAKLSEEETVKTLYERINSAIKLRLRSDVKVGTCLSGGLDSSAIASMVSKDYFKEKNEQFVAIHAKSIETKTDESYYANLVTDYCNIDMHTVVPQLDDITRDIDEVFYTQEEPFSGISVFMQYYVMKEANKLGCKVMLDGQGADESLFGYEFYYSIYLASMLKKFKFLRFIKEYRKIKLFKFSVTNILMRITIALSYNVRRIMYYSEKRKLNIKIKYNTNHLKHLFDMKNQVEFQKKELMYRKLPAILKFGDKNAMRHAIEARMPFVDYKFVEKAISFNDDFKFKGGYLKYTLRKVVEKILPKEIVWRTNKFAFEAPTDLWITKNTERMLSSIKDSVILDKIIDIKDEKLKTNNKLFWKLYSIATWERVYSVKFE